MTVEFLWTNHFCKRNAIVFIKQWIYRLIFLITETLFQKASKYACTSESYISCVVGDFHSHCNFTHDLLCVDYLIAWQGNYTALCLYSRMHTFTASTPNLEEIIVCSESLACAFGIVHRKWRSQQWPLAESGFVFWSKLQFPLLILFTRRACFTG